MNTMAEKRLPKHIAIIIDGVEQDFERMKRIAHHCKSRDIELITFYMPILPRAKVRESIEGIGLQGARVKWGDGREEITRAAKRIGAKIHQGLISAEDVDLELLQKHLDEPDKPPPDMIIFMGSEDEKNSMSLANCGVWQAAYAEFLAGKPWSEFGIEDLERAIANFQDRDRRYGGLSKKEFS